MQSPLKRLVLISADPKTHVEFARQYIELGFDHLFFHSAGLDQRAFLHGYGRDVLPQLRQLHEAKVKSAA
jgi:coenzyme F420-dependent glucose-6-phosphate dehydrogenase